MSLDLSLGVFKKAVEQKFQNRVMSIIKMISPEELIKGEYTTVLTKDMVNKKDNFLYNYTTTKYERLCS